MASSSYLVPEAGVDQCDRTRGVVHARAREHVGEGVVGVVLEQGGLLAPHHCPSLLFNRYGRISAHLEPGAVPAPAAGGAGTGPLRPHPEVFNVLRASRVGVGSRVLGERGAFRRVYPGASMRIVSSEGWSIKTIVDPHLFGVELRVVVAVRGLEEVLRRELELLLRGCTAANRAGSSLEHRITAPSRHYGDHEGRCSPCTSAGPAGSSP